MIRVNVTYANKPGGRFDHDYYVNRHIPMVRERCGPFGLQDVTVDRGVAGVAPGSPAAYACVASLAFATPEGLREALAAHGAEIMGDIPNYTDIEPVIQVSEILV
jgi:uncharacterized protein (TIGR02118 family)